MAEQVFSRCDLVFIINASNSPAQVTVCAGQSNICFTIELDAYDAASFIAAFDGRVTWNENTYPGVYVYAVETTLCPR